MRHRAAAFGGAEVRGYHDRRLVSSKGSYGGRGETLISLRPQSRLLPAQSRSARFASSNTLCTGMLAHLQRGLAPSASESLTRRHARAPPPRPRLSQTPPTAAWRAPRQAPCSRRPLHLLVHAARARASRRRAPRAAVHERASVSTVALVVVVRVCAMACAHAHVSLSLRVADTRAGLISKCA
jgi:hypothetical protein